MTTPDNRNGVLTMAHMKGGGFRLWSWLSLERNRKAESRFDLLATEYGFMLRSTRPLKGSPEEKKHEPTISTTLSSTCRAFLLKTYRCRSVHPHRVWCLPQNAIPRRQPFLCFLVLLARGNAFVRAGL